MQSSLQTEKNDNLILNQESIDILLVEDNPIIAKNTVLFLQKKGHRVDSIHSGEKAISLLQENDYDVLLFDVVLPGIDGFSLAKEVRSTHNIITPIILLTSKSTLNDKLEGFNAGADDYLIKPFLFEELEIRIAAVHRRAEGLVSQESTLGNWCLNKNTLEIKYKDQVITTTRVGFNIFKILMASYPNMLPRKELEKKLWGDHPPDSDALRSHIFSLRKSIASVCKTSVIKTIRGIGFQLDIEKT